tara:strand:- start:115 stop:552 length:438 start_codon:yes stop_codon:yes gene_type:complete
MNNFCNASIRLVLIAFIPLNILNSNFIKAADCSSEINNKVVIWSINKIIESNFATARSIQCDEVKNLNQMKREQIYITSGRKRGEATICLSDESDYPCKFVIGIIKPQFDSSTALSEIYSFTPPKSSQLNETVERLFLKPSSLIQ